MLSDSLDPDQNLQSGSKLFIWYDVCCNIRGDFVRGGGGGGLCPSCKIHQGDYVLVVKFTRGDYVLVVKFIGGGGDFVHVYKNEQGEFCAGGLCPYPFLYILGSFLKVKVQNGGYILGC